MNNNFERVLISKMKGYLHLRIQKKNKMGAASLYWFVLRADGYLTFWENESQQDNPQKLIGLIQMKDVRSLDLLSSEQNKRRSVFTMSNSKPKIRLATENDQFQLVRYL